VSDDVAPLAVKSPCVSICALDSDDICVGCYRSALEITDWVVMTDEAKREVLRRCAVRAQDSGNMIFS
jgi:predicted Fe-S protein YdhL (DUF1289 family)